MVLLYRKLLFQSDENSGTSSPVLTEEAELFVGPAFEAGDGAQIGPDGRKLAVGHALELGPRHHLEHIAVEGKPDAFSLWLAGGGVKGGVVYGETDEFSYNIVRDPVHIRDLQATILHCFGIDNEKFSYKYQGLDQKLTGVEKASVVKGVLT
jgi:hypothetical protein